VLFLPHPEDLPAKNALSYTLRGAFVAQEQTKIQRQ
jgi:hypothetical protein